MRKILITGKTGLVGSSLIRAFTSDQDQEIISTDSTNLNLLDALRVESFIDELKPDLIIMAAAKVGGISANIQAPASFLVDNTIMQTNMFAAANKNEVARLVFLSSACVYPLSAKFPLKESSLLSGDVEPTTKPYAMSKIIGIEMVRSFRAQYARDWISVIPSNIYGPGDNFRPDSSHVMAALMRKFLSAKKNRDATVEVWGTGNAMREFTHVDDLASGIKLVEEMYHNPEPINIASGQEISIAELAEIILEVSGFSGRIVFDKSKPDGAARKLQDSSKIRDLGWTPKIDLKEGILATYSWLEEHLPSGAVRI
jgi:GDP-L-fucose synthase